MGSLSSKSGGNGAGEFVDRTGGLLVSTRGTTIRLNHLVRLYDGTSSYYGISSQAKKAPDQSLESKDRVYVLRLRNPDVSLPIILYQGDRGVLQVTIFEDAYLTKEVAHYGVVLPPVFASGTTAFDGPRSVVRFGTMVETVEEEEGVPFRIASFESVRSQNEHVFINHLFSVHCASSNENSDTDLPIDKAYQQLTMTTVMEGKNVWSPPLTLTLYRFKSQFKQDSKEKTPITKEDTSRLGKDWTSQPALKLVDGDDEDTITLSGTVSFQRPPGEFYSLPFYDTVAV